MRTDTAKPEAGYVEEFHINGDEVARIGIQPLADFSEDWQLIGCDWTTAQAYVGIVHDRGAYLVELTTPAARKRLRELRRASK